MRPYDTSIWWKRTSGFVTSVGKDPRGQLPIEPPMSPSRSPVGWPGHWNNSRSRPHRNHHPCICIICPAGGPMERTIGGPYPYPTQPYVSGVCPPAACPLRAAETDGLGCWDWLSDGWVWANWPGGRGAWAAKHGRCGFMHACPKCPCMQQYKFALLDRGWHALDVLIWSKSCCIMGTDG